MNGKFFDYIPEYEAKRYVPHLADLTLEDAVEYVKFNTLLWEKLYDVPEHPNGMVKHLVMRHMTLLNDEKSYADEALITYYELHGK